jgi:hypothetical protein
MKLNGCVALDEALELDVDFELELEADDVGLARLRASFRLSSISFSYSL